MRLKVLLSYWYYKDVDLEALFEKYFKDNYPEIFADSGAFSAMTQGGEVNLQEYANWIKRWQHLFTTYANLDVIKNAEKTWENQQRLEDLGLQPLPAFHILEDWKWLEMYVDRYSYIALGIAGRQIEKDAIFRFIIKCFQIAGDKSVFHGFALTSWEVMRSFRWYSVDSSSWGSGFRYGRVPVFDFNKGRFFAGKLGDGKDWNKLGEVVRKYGFDPIDFADRNRNDRVKICALSALSYIRAEQWLKKFHGPIYIPGNSDHEELHGHLCCGFPGGDVNNKGSNTSLNNLAKSLDDCVVLRSHLADANPQRFIDAKTGVSGVHLHLSDTGGIGENYAKAEQGVKTYLAEIMKDMKDI